MPKPWYRVPVGGIVALLLVLLWVWRSDSASGLERFWIGMLAIATGFGIWGLVRAIQTRIWVAQEDRAHPDRIYDSAYSVAQTHIVTHISILVTTVALLGFGVLQAFTVPINPGRPPTRGTYVLTGVFFLIGVTKTFLNWYLVYKRDRLTKVVLEIGGD